MLAKQQYGKRLNAEVFPGLQGGPLVHVIAAKAVAFKLAMSNEFKMKQRQIIANAKALAQHLKNAGLKLVSGGTDNHLLLVDLTDLGVTGRDAQTALEGVGIAVNKNTIPFDKRSANVTSGIRLGTPSVTMRGMKEPEMAIMASIIVDVLKRPTDQGSFQGIRDGVRSLCDAFPLYRAVAS